VSHVLCRRVARALPAISSLCGGSALGALGGVCLNSLPFPEDIRYGGNGGAAQRYEFRHGGEWQQGGAWGWGNGDAGWYEGRRFVSCSL
jgi:hypothetical protein